MAYIYKAYNKLKVWLAVSNYSIKGKGFYISISNI
jgi:hypothetical protein